MTLSVFQVTCMWQLWHARQVHTFTKYFRRKWIKKMCGCIPDNKQLKFKYLYNAYYKFDENSNQLFRRKSFFFFFYRMFKNICAHNFKRMHLPCAMWQTSVASMVSYFLIDFHSMSSFVSPSKLLFERNR